nr:MAG TPA: hypothetical protein [Caudoviricetes sp.]
MISAFTSLNCLIIWILARRIGELLPATQDLFLAKCCVNPVTKPTTWWQMTIIAH